MVGSSFLRASMRRLQPGELHVWWLAASAPGYLGSVLSDEERREADCFRHGFDRACYVASHAGLRVLLGRYLGEEPRHVPIEREPCWHCGGPHGKPVVAVEPPLHFSMSHAAGVTIYGVSAHRIGVDLEPGGALADEAAVLPYMTTSERLDLQELPPRDRPRAALRCWVRKEAYAKGTGEGITDDLATFEFGVAGEPRTPGAALAGWTLVDLQVSRGFIASAAVAYASDKLRILYAALEF